MNRLSYVGFFLGFAVAGTLFFCAGFMMCYSLYPPYGGLIFQPHYAELPSNSPVDPGILAKTDLVPAQIPPRSYAERQAILARSAQRAGTTGLLEQAEQQTYDTMKSQVRDSIVGGTRSWIQQSAGRLGPLLSSVVSPLIQNLPGQNADQPVSDTQSSSSTFQPVNDPKESSTATTSADPSQTLLNPTASEKSIFRSAPKQSVNKAIPAQGSLYALRVHAFKDRASALKLAEELKYQGFEGYVVPLWRENRLEFQVRSGLYQDFSQAQMAARILRDKGMELTNIIIADAQEERLQP